MSTIDLIQQELMAGYEALTLPNGLGSPTAYAIEPADPSTVTLPAAIVERGIKLADVPLASDRRQITREFITDVWCYQVEPEEDPFASERNQARDCIEVVERGFEPLDLDTFGVLFHEMNADTGDTELFSRRETNHYIGMRFRHTVTYIQVRS